MRNKADPKIEELQKKIKALEKEIHATQRESSKQKTVSRKEEKEKRLVPRKTLYKWEAPAIVFVRRDKAWFLKGTIVALLSILFFAFLQDFVVILVICVVTLIAFLLASIPPHKVRHKITNKGIFSIDNFYQWKDLGEFLVASKHGQKIVYIQTKLRFPSRIMMLVGRREELKVVKYLSEYLEYRELEKKQGWLSRISDGEMLSSKYYHKRLNKRSPRKKKVK